ncbi:MAG TPA: hypothetical protein VF981_06200 [Gemmatimonadaceae bacterium]
MSSYRVPLIVLSLQVLAASAGAAQQLREAPDSAGVGRAEVSLPRPNRAGVPDKPACVVPLCERAGPVPAQDSTSVRRGNYAWWGLAIGVGAGWFISNQACRREECFGTGFGLMMVAGGALGLIVGLLVSG